MQTSLLTSFATVLLGCAVLAVAPGGCGGGSTNLFTDGDASTVDPNTTGAGGSQAGPGDDAGPSSTSTSCASDKDCAAKHQLCDTVRSVCANCLTSTDCGANMDCQRGSCVAFTPCMSSLQCGKDQVCDTSTKRCVECLTKADCKDGEACVNQTCRAACSSDKDCRMLSQLCDPMQMVCVECVGNADCPSNKSCVDQACVDRACSPGSSTCRGGGVSTCNGDGSGYGAVAMCPADHPCVEATGKASCAGTDAGASTCSGTPTVWFVVSRSGAMFSSQFVDTTTHWASVLQAFNTDGPLRDYQAKLSIGLSTFAGEATTPACPDLLTVQPAKENAAAISSALGATQRPTKGETPTTAAYAAVVTMLQSQPAGPKYIVLIGDAAPDRCSDPSTYCAQDELVQAVQSAYGAGIKTKIIGLPNGAITAALWTEFLQDVANAGDGQGVAYTGTAADEFQCKPFKASYLPTGGTPGTAKYSAVTSSAELSTAIAGVLGAIGCP
jgi:hypothetical protein